MKSNDKYFNKAFEFILLMGIISLFSDMTHEGARSILGDYLNLTGASAATIGFVSGLGELCGYSLRLLSGFIADIAECVNNNIFHVDPIFDFYTM